jgi:hypothetical protein
MMWFDDRGTRNHAHFGRKVKKQFKNPQTGRKKWYVGHISMMYKSKTGKSVDDVYHVKYEDGDSEDCHLHEFEFVDMPRSNLWSRVWDSAKRLTSL